MQAKAESKGGMVIIVSLLVAMLMNVMPLPDLISMFKPDWVALVLIYWVMALPNRVGVFSGWILGLFVDVLYGTLFGIHALSLAVVAFLVQMIYHRLRLFPRWKQAINVAVVVGIHRLIVVTLTGLVEPVKADYTYWLPLVGVAIFWPWVFILLRDIRRKFC
ncbi:rod shape-determining protein MreD [Aliikangiella coralliicola]|uniref:Rod shape-determining protein MreD n=1 Tax=Aliikangiella coralliicola TaxID=2592383 RepID=A0A545UB25_9GAMM|nr:rod shape-determining protein MreD [Aliikangiella coralliicola]TQV86669.1 rod shape-determining protein MreD [Aliikangiella coralliicola]